MKSLEGLSSKQLQELVAAAAQRQAELATETLTRVRNRILKLIADEGLTVDAVLGNQRDKRRVGAKAQAVKYRNPKDPTQTWVGHGKRPFWLRDAVKAGKPLSTFVVGSGTTAPAKAKAAAKTTAKPTKKKPAGKKRTGKAAR